MVTKIGGLTPTVFQAIVWTTVALAIVFVACRLLINRHVHGRVSTNDACVCLALAILISMGAMYHYITAPIFQIRRISQGEEPYTPDIGPVAHFFLKLQFAIIVLYWTCLWTIKMSFLMYYRTLFENLPGHLVWWTVASIFTLLAYLGCWAIQLAACYPISTYFTIGACETRRDITVSNASLYYATVADILCDLLVMALPLRLVWGLRIDRKRKIGLAGIFLLGLVDIIFAIVRVIETSASAHHVDVVWLGFWSMIEASVGIIVSCLLSFRIFFNIRRRSSLPKPPFSSYKRSSAPSNHLNVVLESKEGTDEERPVEVSVQQTAS